MVSLNFKVPLKYIYPQFHLVVLTIDNRTIVEVFGIKIDIQSSWHKDELQMSELVETVPQDKQKEVSEPVTFMNLIHKNWNVRVSQWSCIYYTAFLLSFLYVIYQFKGIKGNCA